MERIQRGARGIARGAKEKCAMYICNCNVRKRMTERLNDAVYRVHNNNNQDECC